MEHLAPEVRRALAADLVIDITTTGRRTGQKRRLEIWFLNLDDTIFIMGASGRRDWFANLLANPDFEFHLKESTTADLVAHAEPIDDPDLRSTVFAAATERWKLGGSTFDESKHRAPLVRVTFPVANQ